jgi:hypothetical protein
LALSSFIVVRVMPGTARLGLRNPPLYSATCSAAGAEVVLTVSSLTASLFALEF